MEFLLVIQVFGLGANWMKLLLKLLSTQKIYSQKLEFDIIKLLNIKEEFWGYNLKWAYKLLLDKVLMQSTCAKSKHFWIK